MGEINKKIKLNMVREDIIFILNENPQGMTCSQMQEAYNKKFGVDFPIKWFRSWLQYMQKLNITMMIGSAKKVPGIWKNKER